MTSVSGRTPAVSKRRDKNRQGTMTPNRPAAILAIAAVLICCAIGFVSADPKSAMEYQLERYVKPCVVEGINCPADGSMGNVGRMERELPNMMRDYGRLSRRPLPQDCKCDWDKCVRVCWYELTKASILTEYEGFLTDRRRRRRR